MTEQIALGPAWPHFAEGLFMCVIAKIKPPGLELYGEGWLSRMAEGSRVNVGNAFAIHVRAPVFMSPENAKIISKLCIMNIS